MLEQIVEHKHEEIGRRQADRPLASFMDRLETSDRSVKRALEKPGSRFIMEYKKSSPSAGVIRTDLEVDDAAKAYAGVADVISVLADKRFFGGSLDDLSKMRGLVGVPVLCKDVVVSPYQIYEARLFGADAVLLMLSVLDDENYRTCREAARRLDLDVITEVHSEAEAKRAVDLDAEIIGINNRDLNTLTTDLEVTCRLAERIPGDRLIIAESGIKAHRDVRRLSRFADAFLVGTSLMKAPRPDLAARELVFGRVKVCGHRTPEGLRDAYDAGASMGGMIFASQSPRHVGRDEARDLAGGSDLPLVGVFVNQSAGEISEIASELGLSAVQLHGDEDIDDIMALRRRLPEFCEIWKAIRVRGRVPEQLPAGTDRTLLDSFDPAMRGGSGRTFDWRGLKNRPDKDAIILAGGLSEDNGGEAAEIGMWGLDVCSGVESAPGIKDVARLEGFFRSLRPAGRHDAAVRQQET